MGLQTEVRLPVNAGPTVGVKQESLPAANADALRGKSHVYWGAVATAIFTLVYTALYWNRFLSPSAGATSFYAAEQILHGRMPYRDFLFLTPPLHALKIAALIQLFGDKLVVPRFESMIERVLLSLLIYFWLVRIFRVSAVMPATVFGITVFGEDCADSLANYHHDSAFWAVCAGLCASLYLARTSNRGRIVMAVASGMFAGLCFATKQTVGLGILASIPILIALLHLRERRYRQAAGFALCYMAGWLVPIGALLLWLYRGNALAQFFHSVFMIDSSKGELRTILSRPFNQLPGLFSCVAFATLVLALLVLRLRDRGRPDSIRRTFVLAGGIAAAIALAVFSVYSGTMWPGSFQPRPPFSANPHELMIARAFILFRWGTLLLPISGSILVFFYIGVRYARGPLTPRSANLWLLSAVSFSVAYMLALSWQTFSPMALPGVALIVAAGLDRLDSSRSVPAYAAAGCFCVLVYCYVGIKLMNPYTWMAWQEAPSNQATHESALPKLKGLRLSEPTLTYVENTTRLILSHSAPSDSVLVYPYFPIFYALTDRRPATYVFNHYLDVCPDAICKAEAETLRAKSPAVIVYMQEDEERRAQDEAVFRAGKVSGSRQVAKAIEEIASSYNCLYSFRIPGSSAWMYVYSKN